MNRESCLERIRAAKRVVIKVGTQLLTDPDGEDGVSLAMLELLRDEILFLRERGAEVLLVSSGAVGVGRKILDRYRPHRRESLSITRKQALSALGQGPLITRYSKIFGEAGIPVAQLLITARGFRDRRAYLNIGHTIHELVGLDALAVINENDTVSTEELQFGDNDMLSAACASLFRADLLLILTSVNGFYMDGERVPFLSSVTDREMAQAKGPAGPGSGGMATKLRAGQLLSQSGEILAILPGSAPAPIRSLFAGEDLGTIICSPPTRKRLSARKRWLLYTRTRGGIVVDAGARKALQERGSSLLPAGLIKTYGHFLAGDVVDLQDEEERILGRGIVNYSYRELLAVIGKGGEEIRQAGMLSRAPEVIHRNNMILEL